MDTSVDELPVWLLVGSFVLAGLLSLLIALHISLVQIYRRRLQRIHHECTQVRGSQLKWKPSWWLANKVTCYSYVQCLFCMKKPLITGLDDITDVGYDDTCIVPHIDIPDMPPPRVNRRRSRLMDGSRDVIEDDRPESDRSSNDSESGTHTRPLGINGKPCERETHPPRQDYDQLNVSKDSNSPNVDRHGNRRYSLISDNTTATDNQSTNLIDDIPSPILTKPQSPLINLNQPVSGLAYPGGVVIPYPAPINIASPRSPTGLPYMQMVNQSGSPVCVSPTLENQQSCYSYLPHLVGVQPSVMQPISAYQVQPGFGIAQTESVVQPTGTQGMVQPTVSQGIIQPIVGQYTIPQMVAPAMNQPMVTQSLGASSTAPIAPGQASVLPESHGIAQPVTSRQTVQPKHSLHPHPTRNMNQTPTSTNYNQPPVRNIPFQSPQSSTPSSGSAGSSQQIPVITKESPDGGNYVDLERAEATIRRGIIDDIIQYLQRKKVKSEPEKTAQSILRTGDQPKQSDRHVSINRLNEVLKFRTYDPTYEEINFTWGKEPSTTVSDGLHAGMDITESIMSVDSIMEEINENPFDNSVEDMQLEQVTEKDTKTGDSDKNKNACRATSIADIHKTESDTQTYIAYSTLLYEELDSCDFVNVIPVNINMVSEDIYQPDILRKVNESCYCGNTSTIVDVLNAETVETVCEERLRFDDNIKDTDKNTDTDEMLAISVQPLVLIQSVAMLQLDYDEKVPLYECVKLDATSTINGSMCFECTVDWDMDNAIASLPTHDIFKTVDIIEIMEMHTVLIGTVQNYQYDAKSSIHTIYGTALHAIVPDSSAYSLVTTTPDIVDFPYNVNTQNGNGHNYVYSEPKYHERIFQSSSDPLLQTNRSQFQAPAYHQNIPMQNARLHPNHIRVYSSYWERPPIYRHNYYGHVEWRPAPLRNMYYQQVPHIHGIHDPYYQQNAPYGHMQFSRMPFGLMNTPEHTFWDPRYHARVPPPQFNPNVADTLLVSDKSRKEDLTDENRYFQDGVLKSSGDSSIPNDVSDSRWNLLSNIKSTDTQHTVLYRDESSISLVDSLSATSNATLLPSSPIEVNLDPSRSTIETQHKNTNVSETSTCCDKQYSVDVQSHRIVSGDPGRENMDPENMISKNGVIDSSVLHSDKSIFGIIDRVEHEISPPNECTDFLSENVIDVDIKNGKTNRQDTIKDCHEAREDDKITTEEPESTDVLLPNESTETCEIATEECFVQRDFSVISTEDEAFERLENETTSVKDTSDDDGLENTLADLIDNIIESDKNNIPAAKKHSFSTFFNMSNPEYIDDDTNSLHLFDSDTETENEVNVGGCENLLSLPEIKVSHEILSGNPHITASPIIDRISVLGVEADDFDVKCDNQRHPFFIHDSLLGMSDLETKKIETSATENELALVSEVRDRCNNNDRSDICNTLGQECDDGTSKVIYDSGLMISPYVSQSGSLTNRDYRCTFHPYFDKLEVGESVVTEDCNDTSDRLIDSTDASVDDEITFKFNDVSSIKSTNEEIVSSDSDVTNMIPDSPATNFCDHTARLEQVLGNTAVISNIGETDRRSGELGHVADLQVEMVLPLYITPRKNENKDPRMYVPTKSIPATPVCKDSHDIPAISDGGITFHSIRHYFETKSKNNLSCDNRRGSKVRASIDSKHITMNDISGIAQEQHGFAHFEGHPVARITENNEPQIYNNSADGVSNWDCNIHPILLTEVANRVDVRMKYSPNDTESEVDIDPIVIAMD